MPPRKSKRLRQEAPEHNELPSATRRKRPLVDYLDAMSLTRAGFAECCYRPERHTYSSAVHRHLRFVGELVFWDDFKVIVRNNFKDIFGHWDKGNVRPLDVELREPDENSLHHEHYLCGEEISVNGRYTNNVLHVMTAVAKELGFPVRFGDWNASFERTKASPAKDISRKSPDYAVLGDEISDGSFSYARAAGEGKSLFEQHPLHDWVREAKNGKENLFRNFLASYMWEYKLTYAFVSNYRYTVFLKREIVEGKSRLLYSDKIRASQSSDLTASTGEVSVRECMLFLLSACSKPGYICPNDGDKQEWVEDNRRGRR
ncbi:hypothetical protein DTO271G3_7979 [Paecilomyces variotii]|nr:hypothetical protein DTO271G3_7979 [Paecilomyces variotii]